MLDPFLIRLLIGALIIFIFEALFGIIPMQPQAKQILNVILIIAVVLYIVLGSFLGLSR